jgi:SP family general alpha glucoside:H+ symporter-like MFS transporter
MSDPKAFDGDMETKGHQAQVEHVYDADEKARYADMKADAVEAENAEHKLGVISAIKGYPMAATWAFVISCTIVSCVLSSRTGDFC